MWYVQDFVHLNYLSVVDKALTSDDIFNNFKQMQSYCTVVGESGAREARSWTDRVKKNKSIHKNVEKFRLADDFGNPKLFDSPDYGKISPRTLRYINTLYNIEKRFGSLRDKNILEIGVGYGGLCHVVSSYFNPKSYQLVDLPNVLLLARKCLEKLGTRNLAIERDLEEQKTFIEKICSEDTEDIFSFKHDDCEFDLLVSEFCVTEMKDSGIEYFYDRYFQRSKNIYIASNVRTKRKCEFLNKLEQIFTLELLPEHPENLHRPENCIIIGKRK